MIKRKQILLESTNTQASSVVDNRSIRTYHQQWQRALLKPATIRRNKEAIKRKNQLIANRLDTSKTPININVLREIQNFQDKQSPSLNQDEQFQIQQRAMYNARQTPLIPFITDLDFSLVSELSQEQTDIWMGVLTLVKNMNEECSSFE